MVPGHRIWCDAVGAHDDEHHVGVHAQQRAQPAGHGAFESAGVTMLPHSGQKPRRPMEEVLELALRYQLLSSQTSFVAVEERVLLIAANGLFVAGPGRRDCWRS